jgi:DNA repair protein RecO (recombination protein O)
MIVKTKAIVLTSIKYGDTDLIVKCFTEEGIKSYLLKRIFKSNNKRARTAAKQLNISYFQPLTLLNLTANHNNKGNLNSIREVGISYMYQSVSTDIYKQSIALFLAEVLTLCLKEEESNKTLFQFIETSFIWLDNHDTTANFHLLFLLSLSKYLGFYPETKIKSAIYFDLTEGLFCDSKPLNNYVSGNKLIYFKSLIGIKFDDIERLRLNSKSRKIVLNTLLEYFELHLPGFKKPKSLYVLNEVFNENS